MNLMQFQNTILYCLSYLLLGSKLFTRKGMPHLVNMWHVHKVLFFFFESTVKKGDFLTIHIDDEHFLWSSMLVTLQFTLFIT